MTLRNLRLKNNASAYLIRDKRTTARRSESARSTQTTMKLVTQTTRISSRPHVVTHEHTHIENPFDLYRCRCRESMADSGIVCFPHETANRQPQSWH
jgi:hypothetical protein